MICLFFLWFQKRFSNFLMGFSMHIYKFFLKTLKNLKTIKTLKRDKN